MCVEDPVKEGNYYCDCDAASDGDTSFSGLYCEHRATEYCSAENRKTTFCTNGGSCFKTGRGDNKSFGCTCLDGFKGDYCQCSMQVPDDWPTMLLTADGTARTRAGGLGPGAISIISIMSIVIVSILGVFGYRRFTTRQSSDVPVEQPPPELTMAGSEDAGASLPHPDEVRQSVAEETGGSPSRNRAEPKAVMDGEDEENMDEVNMGNEII